MQYLIERENELYEILLRQFGYAELLCVTYNSAGVSLVHIP